MQVFKVKKVMCGVVLRAICDEVRIPGEGYGAYGLDMWVVTLCLWGPGKVDGMSSYMTIIYLNLYRPNL